MSKWNWKHTVFSIAQLGGVAVEAIAQWGATNPLPFHLTAATLIGIGTVFGYITEKLGPSNAS